jgi:uncharacterized repeat protein (TIGR01451 family)
MVTIENKDDTIYVGEDVEYTITYHNTTGKTLSDAVLQVVLPQGVSAQQATAGRMVSVNTMEADLGTLAPGAAGSIFLVAHVQDGVPKNETLVSTATLSYVLPNKVHDSAVSYVLNHASASNFLGGLALGSGFFPTTIWGWLITIFIILALILIIRRFSRASAGHGHGGGHH